MRRWIANTARTTWRTVRAGTVNGRAARAAIRGREHGYDDLRLPLTVPVQRPERPVRSRATIAARAALSGPTHAPAPRGRAAFARPDPACAGIDQSGRGCRY